jgi:hypothetical protein
LRRPHRAQLQNQVFRPSDGKPMLAMADAGEVGVELGPVEYLRHGAQRVLLAPDLNEAAKKLNEAAKKRGVKRVCIPNHATKSAARKREQKKRWFRSGQK